MDKQVTVVDIKTAYVKLSKTATAYNKKIMQEVVAELYEAVQDAKSN